MSTTTNIEWIDATWNPGTGGTTGVRLHPDRLQQPLSWRKPRKVFVNSLADLFHDDIPDGYIGSVWNTMALTPRHTYQILTKRPARMRALLNKWAADDWHWRDKDMRWCGPIAGPLPNVWLGVSVENQKWADRRIPDLLDTPAAIRWLSCEPLLGPVDLGHLNTREGTVDALLGNLDHVRGPDGNLTSMNNPRPLPRIDWVVCGGESGPDARPMHPEWARSLRDQCDAASVPFHFKQWGEWGPAPWVVRVCDPAIGWQGTPDELATAKADAEARGATHVYASWAHEYNHELYQPPHKPWSTERTELPDLHHAPMRKWGKKTAGRHLDGRTHDAYPDTTETTP